MQHHRLSLLSDESPRALHIPPLRAVFVKASLLEVSRSDAQHLPVGGRRSLCVDLKERTLVHASDHVLGWVSVTLYSRPKPVGVPKGDSSCPRSSSPRRSTMSRSG